jgi:hypothetical protein
VIADAGYQGVINVSRAPVKETQETYAGRFAAA